MKTAFATLIMAFFASAATAQQKPVAEYSWQALADRDNSRLGRS